MEQDTRHFSGLAPGLDYTIPRLIEHVAARYQDKPFGVAEDGTITSFVGFASRVAGFGAELLRLGVARGDRIAILAPNSAEWMIAAAAAMGI